MTLPLDLIVIRHGQSEANTRQKAPHDEIRDDLTPLTQRGIEQAKATGDWLRRNGLTDFARYYTSPYTRARQTAALLALDGMWAIDNRCRERNAGAASLDVHNPQQHKWYGRPYKGESLATDVRQRFESMMDTWQQEASASRILVITHGKFMTVVRFVLEQMTVEEWLEKDQRDSIENCQVLHYSRRNPATNTVAAHIRWMRSVCPWDRSHSWNNGHWMELRPLQAHCHRDLGTLYAATGQREQARTALFTAIEMYKSMDMTFWLPQTEAVLVQVEGERGTPE